MDEIRRITEKYDASYVRDKLVSAEDANEFATVFYKDAAEIYDCITRIKNIERNPTGFSIDDAPVLGLLVRIWKLLKEVIRYYEQDNAEIISFLDRPILEAAVLASYLMTKDSSVMEDYRKCSYKSRLRILQALEGGSPFYETKAGKRILRSIREKMEFEKLTVADFTVQQKNKWKIDGKSFYDIFSEVEHADFYASSYGMMSETIHGSWNESMDWCLRKNDDGTFSTYPFHHPADIRFVTPMLRFINRPFRLWVKRVEIDDEGNLSGLLDWIDGVNTALFIKFDRHYEGDQTSRT